MSNDQIQESLTRLRAELSSLDVNDQAARDRMEQLIVDVEHQLDSPDDDIRSDAGAGSLPSLIKQYEAEHPRITGILNDLMMKLSDLGI